MRRLGYVCDKGGSEWNTVLKTVFTLVFIIKCSPSVFGD